MESGSVFLRVRDREKSGMVVSLSLATEEVVSTRHVRIKASKEDAFFDSKPWLDSELEDEFFSVNDDFTPLHDNDEATIPNGSPAPATEAGKRKKLGEHFRESIIWEGRASDDEGNSQVKPSTHVLVYPNKSHFGSTKRPTSAHWIFKEEGSKSRRSRRLIRRCLQRFALCRPSCGNGKKLCSSIAET